MELMELDFVPAPADTSLYQEGVQYLVVDEKGAYHVAVWNGESLILPDMMDIVFEEVGGEGDVDTSPVPLAESAQEPEAEGVTMEDDDAITVTWIAALPEFLARDTL